MQYNADKIKRMAYVDLMALIGEVNRPAGGKKTIRKVVQNTFISEVSKVLDVGCNTGYCSFEIVHLVECEVIGIDINPHMINVAKKIREKDTLKNLLEFKIADGMNLPYKNNIFDLVISGGSTAFMSNKDKAIQEYKRVLKPWGFIADINFFYKKKPPTKLINKLNGLMDINIKPWDINYWLNLYHRQGLEKYFIHLGNVKKVKRKELEIYCQEMTKNINLSQSARALLMKRLADIMWLFNRNHEYLAYGIFILRKRPVQEQISLFGS